MSNLQNNIAAGAIIFMNIALLIWACGDSNTIVHPAFATFSLSNIFLAILTQSF